MACDPDRLVAKRSIVDSTCMEKHVSGKHARSYTQCRVRLDDGQIISLHEPPFEDEHMCLWEIDHGCGSMVQTGIASTLSAPGCRVTSAPTAFGMDLSRRSPRLHHQQSSQKPHSDYSPADDEREPRIAAPLGVSRALAPIGDVAVQLVDVRLEHVDPLLLGERARSLAHQGVFGLHAPIALTL